MAEIAPGSARARVVRIRQERREDALSRGAVAVVLALGGAACDPLDVVVGRRFGDDGAGASSGEGSTGAGVVPAGCVGGTPDVWENVTPPIVSLDFDLPGGSNYGFHNVVVHPLDPRTVYAAADRQGLFRSDDCGATWRKVNTGMGAAEVDQGVAWGLAIDPVSPDTLYVTSGEGALGLFKSENGGVDFRQLFGPGNVTEPINLFGQSAPDLYSVAIDPTDPAHLVCGFHGGWLAQNGSGAWVDAGVVTSTDGGATWTLRPPAPGMGGNHNVFFLDDRNTWLVLGETGDGAYRTTDGGATWQLVNDSHLRVGAGQLYRASDGAYYHTGGFGIFRSTDGGASWTNVIEGLGPSTQGIAGDGVRIWASDGAAVEGPLYGAPFRPFLSALEADGATGWAVTGDQTFDNGANHLAVDRTHGIVYASAWRVGLLRMFTR